MFEFETRHQRFSPLLYFAVFILFCLSPTSLHAQVTAGGADTSSLSETPEPDKGDFQFRPVRTGSPRQTLTTILRLRDDLEQTLLTAGDVKRRVLHERVRLLEEQFRALLDLSSVPRGSRRKIGSETIAFLLDILGRLDLPPMESVPDADAFVDEETPGKWRIPRTPITIVRIEEGPREGEFLFGARTVTIVPGFYERIQHLPLRSSLRIESWHHTIPQWHGPMIPAALVSALPDSLKHTWLDTPIWKILTVVIVTALATLLLVLWHRVVSLRAPENRIAAQLHRVLTPVAIILVVLTLRPFVAVEVNVTGTFAQMVGSAMTLVDYLASVWIFWLLVLTLFEWIILSPKIPDESLDADLLRLGARVIGFVGGVLILAYAAQDVGLPVLGLLAGLGVGGLAMALAIRPTLENLVGGVILYLDRPVRIGDFCSFGTHMGTVESIGVRSTQIRALDRTLISVPNATFADMEIVNWAKCDRMQILTMIGLRYETEPDQVRYVLVKLREMFHAHPRIDRDTVRVRFAGYGVSSLDVEIRVYALTREWNDFYAIREDVFLRVNEIVRESGTGFAFPSQTLYMGRDDALDKERSHAATQQVRSWRSSSQLPFPSLTASRIEQLADTLDYPPLGSPDAESSKALASEAAEPLSSEPQLEDREDAEQKTGPELR